MSQWTTHWLTCRQRCGWRWPVSLPPRLIPTVGHMDACPRCTARRDPQTYMLNLVRLFPRRKIEHYTRTFNTHLEPQVALEALMDLGDARKVVRVQWETIPPRGRKKKGRRAQGDFVYGFEVAAAENDDDQEVTGYESFG